MAQADDPIITMSARAVVAAGVPFAPWGVALTDAGVALDEISSMRAGAEPLVLRVKAAGGPVAERERAQGDWLCDEGGAEPVRLPKTRWWFDQQSNRWASSRTWLDAWEECDDARWMLHAAGEAGMGRRLMVAAACACVRTVLGLHPPNDFEPTVALEVAEAWAANGATDDEVREASDDVYQEASRAYELGDRPRGAICTAAYAASYIAFTDQVAFYAANAAHQAILLGGDKGVMADAVRSKVPTIAVLRAAVRLPK